ncbi:mRNA surveillance protein pelota [Halobacteriales archaeon SW_5_70_135]|nr:MAG: mRNA surveillance protein pelota [Halobacteriales archaeon SW_5_70_135]
MRVQERARGAEGRERWTLVPESLDDLWHLQYVVEPGDLVAGDTTRRVQRDDDRLRDTGGEREHMYVTVRVTDAEFAEFANRLRVGGEIVDCSREDQLGHHHTLNVEPRTEIEIEKRFKPDQRDRIEEAVAASENPDVAVVTVEEGRAFVHTVAQYGVEEYASVSGPTGKGEYARDRSELFARLVDALRPLEVDAVVLAGPGFTKEDALSHLEETAPETAETVTVVDTTSVGDRGVHEVLKRGAVDEIQQETRVAREAEYVDELTARIADDGAVAYGPDAVATAVEYGAVERLLVLDRWLRDRRTERASTSESVAAEAGGGAVHDERSEPSEPDDGDGEVDPDDLIRRVEQQGGDVTVFSAEFAPGQQLDNLGGIAALLRYRID